MHKKNCFIKNISAFMLACLLFYGGCGESVNSSFQTIPNEVRETTVTNMEQANSGQGTSNIIPRTLEVAVNMQAEDIYYQNDNIDILRSVHRCVSDGENIYLAYYEPDLYIMPVGTNEQKPANIDNPQKMKVCHIAMDTYGKIFLLMVDQSNEFWQIWKLDKDFRVNKIIDISSYFQTNQAPFWFLIDKDGTFYFQWLLERNGIIIDSEGRLKHEFTLESLGIRWTYEATVGRNGDIYVIYGNSENKKREICKFDIQNNYLEETDHNLYFPENETFAEMSSGTDTNLLLYSPISGVWAYDNEQGIMQNRVPLSDINYGPNAEFWPLTFLPDGRLLMAGQSEHDGNTDYTNLLLKYVPAGK